MSRVGPGSALREAVCSPLRHRDRSAGSRSLQAPSRRVGTPSLPQQRLLQTTPPSSTQRMFLSEGLVPEPNSSTAGVCDPVRPSSPNSRSAATRAHASWTSERLCCSRHDCRTHSRSVLSSKVTLDTNTSGERSANAVLMTDTVASMQVRKDRATASLILFIQRTSKLYILERSPSRKRLPSHAGS